jgi:hypothetical protein
MICSLNESETTTENIILSQADYDQCNVKSDHIINASKAQTWQGRELVRDNLLGYADWYNKVTGQVMTKRVQKSWWKALQDWQDEQLSTNDLQTAFDAQSKWRMVSDPNQLTKDACAVKASANAVLDESEYTRLL